MLEVKYVAMPITVEQKKEYHRQGFRVIDARFAPEGAEVETAADVADDKAKKAAERKAAREAKKAAAAEQSEE